ncbi:hypothetical protein BGZ98_008858 [Dissophora globulifera]|nr:hypothetical protein BGZ98_008858 [Dissophora globulifera]
MTSLAIPSSFSLANFPVGLGLVAAAHVHLVRDSLGFTAERRKTCSIFQTISKLENLARTFEDLESLTELIKIVDMVLQRFPERRHHRHSRHSTRAHGTTRPKRRRDGKLSKSTRIGGKEHKEGDDKGKRVVPIELDDATQPAYSLVDEGPSRLLHPGTKHSSDDFREASKEKLEVEVSREELEQFSSAYKALRESQLSYVEEVMKRSGRTYPLAMTLTYNAQLSFLLGSLTMLHYIFSTGKFSVIYSRIAAWLPNVGSWLGRRAHVSPSPTSVSFIQQRVQAAASSGSRTGAADTGTGAASGSLSISSTAVAFLPLVPTLLMSGMHFLAAAKTQWVIREIQNELQQERHYSRRLHVVSKFLLLREKRLEWLATEIKIFEEAKRVAEESYEDLELDDDDLDEQGDVPIEAAGSTSASPPLKRRVRPQNYTFGAHNAVYSLLLDQSKFDSFTRNRQDQMNALTQRRMHEESGRGEIQQEGGNLESRRPAEWELFKFSFGPNLEDMDLSLFLNSRQERRRILRQEFEGMREELVLLRTTMLRSELN